jgi:hypothetical protein
MTKLTLVLFHAAAINVYVHVCNIFSSHFDRQYEVVVLDIDKPWEPHCVTSVSKQLLHIVWDTTGSKLLLIDVDGECQVWAMKVHL